MKKPHVLLNTNIQKNDPVTMKYNYGFGENTDDDEGEKDKVRDYVNIGQNLQKSYSKFGRDRSQRIDQRSPELDVPLHVDFIRINFWGQFAVNEYFGRWYQAFGLEVVEVTNFGMSIVFGVAEGNFDKFNTFLSAVEAAIHNAQDHQERKYPKLIHYIEDFELLTTAEIINTEVTAEVFVLKVADLMVHNHELETLIESLKTYLIDRGIEHIVNREIGIVEIYNREGLDLDEIINNFDIFLQATSGRATIIRPDVFNVPSREYGFEVAAGENLPLVGIIDSGIDAHTPLAQLIVTDEELNLTTTSVQQDNIDSGRGHGTAVSALVALGAEAVRQEYKGIITPHCQLLPIKIIDSDSSSISISRVLGLLEMAIERYPHIKIFTLTINFYANKKYNEHYSSYAYALDKFVFEHDCLIFISTGNNSDAIMDTDGYDLDYFENEQANLCSPAESLNNITVGACADSLSIGDYIGISNGKEYPTIYSRKGHYQYELLKGKTKVNKTLFKPDLVMAGGDYCYGKTGLTDIGEGSMLLLSADPTESFYRLLGTSFATPLAANIAVQIQKHYPSLRAASIKALMLNHCSDKWVEDLATNKSMLVGHGCLNNDHAIYSDNNTINFIIEDTISNGELKIVPVNFPDYLITNDLGKKNRILRITATISYQFFPVKESQLGYCPVLIAFSFFKNHEGGAIVEKEHIITSKLKSALNLWSQNCRFKQKPNPFSNTQKLSFVVNVNELLDESNVFKIGVHCFKHPQLRPGEDTPYQKDNRFSIAVSIEETLKQSTGRLYDEMLAVNEVEHILSADQDLDAEA
ncbi:S8 family peptidase [Sphingobacterium shayense]|uniref:S8 family peptidase n=1 Tax=Sphingobacterium shayense TaxID=626343 RepID=UPI0015525740|nr:S8 family peptidase [Sphingobacterium shayense]NQD71456.1 S8 family peptidase [Sphingobacterium shayense]